MGRLQLFSFAYGQTGSGKSYSMVGFGENRGIVPVTCNRLFTVSCPFMFDDMAL